MEIYYTLAFSVEYPPKSRKAWQQSDNYLNEEVKIEKVLQIFSKDLVEITQANPDNNDNDNDNEKSAR